MEDGLGHIDFPDGIDLPEVLILVLMEDGLGQIWILFNM